VRQKQNEAKRKQRQAKLSETKNVKQNNLFESE
jgi:hypothetical protein